MKTSTGCTDCIGAFALLIAVGMAWNWFRDPWQPMYEGVTAYGHNRQNALWLGWAGIMVEAGLAAAIVRPWSYDWSWWRPLLAAALLLPWGVLLFLTAMHAGGVHGLYLLWTVGLVFWLGRVAFRDWEARPDQRLAEAGERRGG